VERRWLLPYKENFMNYSSSIQDAGDEGRLRPEPCPPAQSARRNARNRGVKSAGRRTLPRELALVLVATFVDALQAAGNHALEGYDLLLLLLLLRVFRIHRQSLL